jgi:hypothetical protein
MHHLFEPYVLRQAMGIAPAASDPLDAPMARQVEALVGRLEEERSISRQRDRIADAPPEVQRVLVRLYFEMLFRVLEARSETSH